MRVPVETVGSNNELALIQVEIRNREIKHTDFFDNIVDQTLFKIVHTRMMSFFYV